MSIYKVYIPKDHYVNETISRLRRKKKYYFLFFGGGTGLSTIVSGTKAFYPTPVKQVSVVVAVSDNGGSTGKIRRMYMIPAPGDVRKILTSLAFEDDILKKLFEYRFPESPQLARQNKSELYGHSLGNLILTALTQITGNFAKAVQTASRLLNTFGQVIPLTTTPVDLVARFDNGKVIRGEVQIYAYGKQQKGKIVDIWLEPKSHLKANPKVLEAIHKTDVILFGPGSLYTSVVASFLTPDTKKAIKASNALKIYITNLLTDYGETYNMSAYDHVLAIQKALHGTKPDIAIINTESIPTDILIHYKKAQGSHQVEADLDKFVNNKQPYIAGNFIKILSPQNHVRHDANMVLSTILHLISDSIQRS